MAFKIVKKKSSKAILQIDTRIIGCTCIQSLAKNDGYVALEDCEEHKHLTSLNK